MVVQHNKAAAANEQLYTQFCIGVELGDDTLVRDLIMKGANTMVSYGVDGVIHTPMQSALSKGDIPMVMALLTSRATKIRLADVDSAPKVKRDIMTLLVTRKMSEALEDGAREMLLQRPPPPQTRSTARQSVKVAPSESIAVYVTAQQSLQPHASPTDRPRCPPGDPALSPTTSSNSDAESAGGQTEDEDEEEDDGSPGSSPGGSVVSSGGRSSSCASY